MTVTPKDIYDAYPGSDLLALEPPEENETFEAYKKRMGGNKGILACGDTLFAFLLFEAQDESEPDEVIRLFDRAVADIEQVVETLALKFDKEEDQ
ncbi:hypothetical protein [Sphingorhabdus sp.]|uniref:hypothetical protein n=1 Tax=Sphingorhabdus sp. TaxID=1902408 RepID=UPI00334054A5